MILAGASCDDIFVIVLFSTFTDMAQGGTADLKGFLNIPVSIILGVALGAVIGLLLCLFFKKAYQKDRHIRNSVKIIIIMGMAFLLMSVEVWAENYVAVSGLLAVVAMACIIKLKSNNSVSKRLSEKAGKLWLMAEIMLFVLVGAAVDIRYIFGAGLGALAMIFIALSIRAIGVLLCLIKTKLNFKERLFCVIAYLPKATVQAAIGSIPLAMGLPCGTVVLSVAVLGIMITAPLGAIGIEATYKKLLNK